MKKLLYYLLLCFFLAIVVWNALSKKDSIMGTNNSAPAVGAQSRALAAFMRLH